MQELESRLKDDLCKIGLDVSDCTFVIRGYSKSYFGRYNPNNDNLILYVWKYPNGVMYSYLEILLTAIHESTHRKQWKDPKFKRRKGIMHDPEFYELYNKYVDKAKSMLSCMEVRK